MNWINTPPQQCETDTIIQKTITSIYFKLFLLKVVLQAPESQAVVIHLLLFLHFGLILVETDWHSVICLVFLFFSGCV